MPPSETPKINWKVWASLEGVMKAAGGLGQKLNALYTDSIPGAVLSYSVSGSVQMIAGFVGYFVQTNRPRLAPSKAVWWAIGAGVIATFITVLGIYTFQKGADLGIRSLIVAAAIIPGALLGRALFHDPLTFRQVSGIAVFLCAVWATLDFSHTVPAWAGWTALISVCVAINQILSRKASQTLDSWVTNFWIGTSTLVLCTLTLIFFGATTDLIANTSTGFWIGAIVYGFIILAMIIFRLFAYKGGSTIAFKDLVMQSVFLCTAMIAGKEALKRLKISIIADRTKKPPHSRGLLL